MNIWNSCMSNLSGFLNFCSRCFYVRYSNRTFCTYFIYPTAHFWNLEIIWVFCYLICKAELFQNIHMKSEACKMSATLIDKLTNLKYKVRIFVILILYFHCKIWSTKFQNMIQIFFSRDRSFQRTFAKRYYQNIYEFSVSYWLQMCWRIN